jgi:hypothetical protein
MPGVTAAPALLLLLALALAFAGCGGDEDGEEQGAQDQADTVTVTAPPAEPAEEAPPQTETAPDDDAGDASAQRGCRDLDRTGTIDMAGAGSVRLSRQGGRLSVSQVRPDEGWRAEVERDDDGDEIEVDFRRGDEKVELEAEIDDGRLEVEVCRGDDD